MEMLKGHEILLNRRQDHYWEHLVQRQIPMKGSIGLCLPMDVANDEENCTMNFQR
jgi:hypothetical protein